MSLRNLQVSKRYRSSESNLVDDFYVPCLSNSRLYQRAVGYFTSGSLSHAAKGLAAFLRREGRMQLVASPLFSEADVEAINSGYRERDDVMLERLIQELEGVTDPIILSRLSCLGALIALGRLEIRLAFRVDNRGRVARGIYHEKIGLFTDSEGNRIAFTGSPNETSGGLVENFESIQVFRSWADPEQRVPDLEHDFRRLWENVTQGLAVIDFPRAVREKLIALRRSATEQYDDPEGSNSTLAGKPFSALQTDLAPRGYQESAISAWAANGYRGVLRMATGTGKTKTAMFGISRVAALRGNLLVIVLVPYKHLAEQWARECELFGVSSVLCSSDYPNWATSVSEVRVQMAARRLSFAFLIATYDTFRTDRFRDAYRRFTQTKGLIADEVHHFGAISNRQPLDDFEIRLGLSATPERMFDPEGTAWIFENIGKIIFKLDLVDAIPNYLCPYRYYLHSVELTRTEQEDYQEVVAEIAKKCARGATLDEEDPENNTSLGPLLRRRLEIIGGAANKLDLLRDILRRIIETAGTGSLRFSLFYASSRQFSDLQKMLSESFALKVSKFTFEEDMQERKEILSNFENGRIDAIVAKRCLDEGMDIPATRTAFILASSSNPMEFIQRRGRILRKAPGKEFADIHDFFTTPYRTATANEYDRRLVERELRRAGEFGRTSLNSVEVDDVLWAIKQRYGLLHL